jgi:hypothetical protein
MESHQIKIKFLNSATVVFVLIFIVLFIYLLVLFVVHETTVELSTNDYWEFVEGFNVLNKSNIISYSKQNSFYAYSCRCFIVLLHHTSLTHKGTLWE